MSKYLLHYVLICATAHILITFERTDPMNSLVLYSTIVGGFYVQTKELEAAISSARAHVGNDTWKRGFSGGDPAGATVTAKWYLNEAQILPVAVEGELRHVGFVENRDASGNSYPKLRVGIRNADGDFLLSLDLKGDVAQRLIVKLDNCEPGMHLKISAWPTTVTRDGRSFVNHALSLKDANGEEVRANTDFSAHTKSVTEDVVKTLTSAGITDKKVVATAKATKRVEAHRDLLLQIQERFVGAFAGVGA